MTHRTKRANRELAAKGSRPLRIALFVLGLILIGSVVWMMREEKAQPPAPVPVPTSASTTAALPAESVPPYFESAAAAQPFPELLPASYFAGYPNVARVYRIAGEIPSVLAQQPCYCHCDKFGHRSLLSCYSSDHGGG